MSESSVWNRVWKAESFGDHEAPRILKKNKTKYKCKKATINNFAKILIFRINNLN